MMIDLHSFKTWGEAEDKINQILEDTVVGLFITKDEQHEIMQEYKKEWDKLHKVERNETNNKLDKNNYKINIPFFNGYKPKGYFDIKNETNPRAYVYEKETNDNNDNNIDIKEVSNSQNDIDIKEIPHVNKNEIQTHDKVIMTNGLFKNLIGEVTDIFKTKNIIYYTILMADENTLNIPETNLKLYEKAECNLPKSKEELRDNMDKKIFDTIGNVKVIIEPRKTKVQLMNGIFGDTSFGYEDKNYNKEENIRIAYIHAIRHYCKVLLREE